MPVQGAGLFQQLSAADLSALGELLRYMFYMGGVLMIGHGIWKMIEASQAGKQEGTLGFRSLLIGSALMGMGPIINFISSSMLTAPMPAGDFNRILDFAVVEPGYVPNPAAGSANYTAVTSTFINMMVLFGYWSVGKGLLMLKKTSDGAAPHMDEGALSGLTHIVFGCLLINIRVVLPSVLVTLLGFNASVVAAFMG